MNGWNYVEGNSINRVDPSGRIPTLDGIYAGDYSYSCKCGWIDWGHAGPSNARALVSPEQQKELIKPICGAILDPEKDRAWSEAVFKEYQRFGLLNAKNYEWHPSYVVGGSVIDVGILFGNTCVGGCNMTRPTFAQTSTPKAYAFYSLVYP